MVENRNLQDPLIHWSISQTQTRSRFLRLIQVSEQNNCFPQIPPMHAMLRSFSPPSHDVFGNADPFWGVFQFCAPTIWRSPRLVEESTCRQPAKRVWGPLMCLIIANEPSQHDLPNNGLVLANEPTATACPPESASQPLGLLALLLGARTLLVGLLAFLLGAIGRYLSSHDVTRCPLGNSATSPERLA